MFVRSVRATHVEQTLELPGDALIPEPIASLTNAVTIRAAPHEVWPWLAQMGAGRAGWYGHDSIEDTAHPSADRILPQFQKVGVGTLFPWVPGAKEGFVVLAYHPIRSLVLGAQAADGHPIVTWTFVLEPLPNGHTRLIVRARGGRDYQFHGLPTWMTRRLVSSGHFVMRKQLLGIAQRAERVGAAAYAPPVGAQSESGEQGTALRKSGLTPARVIAGSAGLAAAAYATYTALMWLRHGKAGRSSNAGGETSPSPSAAGTPIGAASQRLPPFD